MSGISNNLMEFYEALLAHYGPQHWWPGRTDFEVMVGAILTQNTNWKNVEKDSPAEATGKLKKGQIIESINGQTLKDIDPRILLGGIITQTEATDGIVKFMIKDTPDTRVLANRNILGGWKTIDQVKTIDEFKVDKKMNPGRPRMKAVTFKPNGKTDKTQWIWSGNILVDILRDQALKMTVKTIDGSDYLFIEVGGYGFNNPKGWKSPLFVMKR